MPSRQINEFLHKGNRKKIKLVSRPALQDDHVVNIADTRIHEEITQNMQNHIAANCQEAMSHLDMYYTFWE